MFTGLIEDIGELVERQSLGKAATLSVRTHLPLHEIRLGDSIAVNGTCLTVAAINHSSSSVQFHTLQETLARTNLGKVALGAGVNLERALRLGDRLGGHLLLGHVDCVSYIERIGRDDADLVVEIQLPDELQTLVISKGSIAVDGISLTIAHLSANSLRLHIIPHTWQATTLAQAQAGSMVNLEADMLGKYIQRRQQLAPAPRAVTEDDLRAAGFFTR